MWGFWIDVIMKDGGRAVHVYWKGILLALGVFLCLRVVFHFVTKSDVIMGTKKFLFLLITFISIVFCLGEIINAAGEFLYSPFRSQWTYNFLSAARNLTKIASAQEKYREFISKGKYADNLKELFNHIYTSDKTKPVELHVRNPEKKLYEGFKYGYNFGMIKKDQHGEPIDLSSSFAYFAVPISYGDTNVHSLIINKNTDVYYKDTGDAKPVIKWPSPSELDKEWVLQPPEYKTLEFILQFIFVMVIIRILILSVKTIREISRRKKRKTYLPECDEE